MSSLLQNKISSSLIPTKVASDISGYNADYLGRLCREKKILGEQLGRSWLIDRESLESFMTLQEEKKRQRSEELRAQRGREYKRAQQPVLESLFSKTANKAAGMRDVIAGTVVAAVTDSRARVEDIARRARAPKQSTRGTAPTSHSYSPRLAALAVALLVVVGSAYASTDSRIVTALSSTPRALVRVASNITPGLIRSSSFRITEVDAPTRIAQSVPVIPTAHDASRSVALLMPSTNAAALATVRDLTDASRAPFAETDTASVARARLSSAQNFVRDPAGSIVRAYVITGQSIYTLGTNIGDAYLAGIRNTGDRALSRAATLRDGIALLPRTSNAILDAYVGGIYAWNDAASKAPTSAMLALYTLGDSISAGTAAVPAFALRQQEEVNLAAAKTAQIGALALKSAPAGAHSATPSLQLAAVIEPVNTLYTKATNVGGAVLSLPVRAENTMLGVAGYVSSVMDGADAPATSQSASVISFLPSSWQLALGAFFHSTGTLAGNFLTSTFHSVANFFPGGNVITPTLTVIRTGPTNTLALPIPANVTHDLSGGVAINTGSRTIIQNIVNNYFPAALSGTAISNEAILAVVRPFVNDSIYASMKNNRNNGGNTSTGTGDVNSDGATLTNVTISSGNATLSTLNASSSTLGTASASTLAVSGTTSLATTSITGDLSVSGTITAGTLAVSNLSSNSAIVAPYFTATSTTGTSTFPNLSTTNLTLGGSTFTSLLGTGLVNSGGVLSISSTSFSGTGSNFNADLLDGYDSSYLLANSFSTSSANAWLMGQTTDALAEGTTNLYFSTSRARDALSVSGTGLSYASTTGILSVASGYSIPLTASTTDWNTAYINRITVANSPLSLINNALSINQASSTASGYLSDTDFNTFNSKQAALTFTYPLLNTANTISLAFGTSTSNIWGGTQTFTNAPVLGSLTGFLKATAGVLSTSLIDLSTDVSSTLSVSHGGTGSTSLTGLLKGNGTGALLTAIDGTDYISPASYGSSFYTYLHATTTDALAEGSTNLYFTSARATANFVSNLSATTSVNSITTLANLSLPLSQTTGTLAQNHGGTGITSYNPGDILYADNSGNLAILPVGSTGTVLKVQAGLPSWGTDQTVGGGGSDGIFATSSGKIYPLDTASTVLVGTNSTSTLNSIFEVNGISYFSNKVGIGTTSPSTQLSVTGNGLFSGTVTSNNFIGTSLTANTLTYTNASKQLSSVTLGTGLSFSGGTLSVSTSTLSGSGSNFSADLLDGLDSTYFLANAFSTTSAAYWKTQNNFYSTTSADYWLTGKTTANLTEGSNLYYTDARVNAYVAASSTIPKTYTSNVFTNSNAFTNGLSVGTLNGPLQANNGVVSATSSVGVLYGGTGLTVAPSYGQILTGNGSGGYALTATSTLGLESILTFASPLSRTGNTVSILQANGSQNGYLSSVDWTAFNNKISSSSLSATGPLSYNPSTGVFSFSTTSISGSGSNFNADFLDGYDSTAFLNGSFSTTSADYWKTQRNFYSTTSADYWLTGKTTANLTEGSNLYFTNARADARINATSTISTLTSAPNLGTVSTTLTGILKATSGVLSTAISGTDYAPATSGNSLLYGNGSGGFLNANISSPLTFAGGFLGIQVANTSQPGYLSSTDWNTFNGKQNLLTGTTGQIPYFSGTDTVTATSSLFIASNGNVGIGSTSPFSTLSVNGTGYFQGSIKVNPALDGTYSQFGTPLVGNPQPIQGTSTDVIVANNVATLANGKHIRAILGISQWQGTTTAATRVLGLSGRGEVNGIGDLTYTALGGSVVGVSGYVSNFGTAVAGTIARSSGVYGQVSMIGNGGGTLTDTASLDAGKPQLVSPWVYTNFAGLRVEGDISGTGTIVNRYGIYIEDLIAPTNRWAIYQVGASDPNYFAGNIGIGTTSPFAKLSVVGDISLSGGIYDNNSTRGTNGQLLQTTGTGVQWVSTSTLGFAGATTGTSILSGNGSGGFNNVNISSPLTFAGGFLGIQVANTSQPGYLTSTDWNTFNSKENALTFTYPLVRSTNTISLAFGTTTANTWSSLQTFSSGISVGGSTFTSLLGTGLSNVAGVLSVSTSSLALDTTYFKQNGNAFGGLATLGTTDSNALRFITGGTERGRFDTNGNFGIGTTSPTETLEVRGNIYADNTAGALRFSVIGANIVNSGGAGNAGTDVLVVATSTTGNSARALAVTANIVGGAGGAVSAQGIATFANLGPGILGNVTTAGLGGGARNRFISSNNLTGYNAAQISGVSAMALTAGTLASTTNAAAFHAESPSISAGSLVTNQYGLWVRGGAVSGTITNRYGVYVEDMVGGTNRYAYYQAGSSDLNYFAGNVGIGTTSPYANLSVTGNIALTGGIYDNNSTRGTLGQVLQTTGTGVQWVSTSTLGFAGATTGTSILSGNGSGGFNNVNISSPLTFTGGFLGIQVANTTQPGYLSSTDWSIFNNKISSTSLSASLGLTYNSSTGVFGVATSSLFTGTTGQVPYFSGTNTLTATSSLFVAANGNIGIGSTSPATKLVVSGDGYVNGYFSVGDSVYNPINASINDVRFVSSVNISDPTKRPKAIGAYMTASAVSGPLTGSVVPTALHGRVAVGTANTQNWNMGIGIAAEAVTDGGTGTITSLAALSLAAANTSLSGISVTNLYGIYGNYLGLGASTLNAAGIALPQIVNSTNSSALVIGTTTIPTGNFGLYDATGYKSYLSGNLGIGTTSPYAKLSVAGDIALTGGIYDNNATRGTPGQVLQTTGTGVQWVSTSTLGFAGATTGTSILSGNGSGGFTNVNISSPLTFTGGFLGIQVANTSQPGYLSSTDWNTFNGKQAALTFSYPLLNTSNTISLAFGTTTANTWSSLQTLAGGFISQASSTVSAALNVGGTGYFAGNVGIGTSSPFAKLSLAGGSLYQSVTVAPTVASSISIASASNGIGTYVQGHYAYSVDAGSGFKLSVIDITVPTAPVVVGTLSDVSNLSGGFTIKVVGKYAYIVASGSNKFAVVDVSNPTAPTLVTALNNSAFNGVRGLYISGHYAYTVNSTGTGTFTVVDIAIPSAPVIVSTTSSAGVLDLMDSVFVSGQYAYVTSLTNNSLTVINVTNPASPVVMGSYVSLTNLGNPKDVWVSGRYAYALGQGSNSLAIIDVSNPSSPTLAGVLSDSTNLNNPKNIFVAGRYAYITSNSGNRFTVVDISNPAAPVVAGSLLDNTNLNNPRGIFVSGKYAYVSAGSKFTVVDIAGIDVASANLGVANAEALSIYENGDIGNDLYVRGGLMVGTGGAQFGGSVAISGTPGVNPFSIASSSGASLLTLTQGGNLGIGTTTPSRTLSVQGSALFSGDLFAANITATGTAAITGTATVGNLINNGVTANTLAYFNGSKQQSSATLGLGLSLTSGTLSVATSSLFTGTTGQVPYFSGTNTLTATSSLFIATNGSVGINNIAPSSLYKLDITGDTRVSGGSNANLIVSSASGSYATLQLTDGTNYFNFQKYYDGSLVIAGNTGDVLHAVGSRVAIGSGVSSVNPSHALEVISTTTSALLVRSNAPGLGEADIRIGAVDAFSALRYGAINYYNTSSQQRISILADNSIEQFTVTNGGNVGIGSTTPFAKLSVTGAGTGTGVNFQTANSSNSPLFTILDNGNVGVGTTSPIVLHTTSVTNDNTTSSYSVLSVIGTTATVFPQNTFNYQSITTAAAGAYASNLDYTLYTPSAVSGNVVTQRFGTIAIPSTSTNTFGSLTGLDYRIINNGTGSGTILTGAVVRTFNNGAGSTVTSVTGLTAAYGIQNVSSQFSTTTAAAGLILSGQNGSINGVIGTRYGVQVSQSSLGTITNDYGVYVTGVGVGGTITNKYDFYGADAAASNYFAGNVGIGSTSPYAKLSVMGAGTGTGVNFQTTNSSNSPLFSILDNGNVGIGTTTPSEKLDVYGNIRLGNLGSVDDGIRGYNSAGTAVFGFTRQDDVTTGSLQIAANGGIGFTTGSSADNAPNSSTAKLFITTSGNVGVGTTTPSSLLEVSGADTGTTATTFTPATTFSIGNRSTTNNTISALAFRTQDLTNGSATSSAQIVSINSSHTATKVSGILSFQTNNAGSLTEKVRITNDGLVGISLTNPSAYLHVSGVTPTTGTSGLDATAAAKIIGASGGNNNANSGFAFAGVGGAITLTGGNGGSISGTPSNGFGGNGGAITITGGAGGSGGGTSPSGGTGGTVSVLAGDSATSVGGTGGDLILRAGGGQVTGSFAGSVYIAGGSFATGVTPGNVILGVSNSIGTPRGLVGIGTTTPWALVSIDPNANNMPATAAEFVIGSSTASHVIVTNIGRVGIGTSSPTAQFHTTGTVRFSNFGAGTLTTDASGNVTASSDERLKDINGSFSRGLAEIQQLDPILYHWNATSGLDRTTQYAGFSAQNVQGVIPEAVDTDPRGYLSLQDRPILAASVNAIKELAGRTTQLSLATTSLSSQITSLSTSFAQLEQNASLPHALTATVINAESLSIAQGVSAGSLTTQTANIDGTVSAARYIVPNVTSVFSFGSTTISMQVPSEALTSGGDVDLFKLAGYAAAGTDALAARAELLALKLDDLTTRVAALEALHAATSTDATANAEGALGLAMTTVKQALEGLGIIVHKGYLALDSLVTHQLFLVKGDDGTSSTGSEVIPSGATELHVSNPLVHPTSKIFLTFTSSVQGSWYISEKKEGTFTITLSQPQSSGTEFDYFLLQTDPNAQIAAAGAPTLPPAGTPEAPATPPATSQDGGPVVTLTGSAAMQVVQGAAWTDPGANAVALAGTDLTGSISVSGSVDTTTAGLYTITYRVTDAAGKEGQASRVVSVLAPTSAPASGSDDTAGDPGAGAVTQAPADPGSGTDTGGPVSAAPDGTPAS